VKYAKEVMDLMAPYPGRHFRMSDLVRYVAPRATGPDRQRIRNGILRVLESLVDSGHVVIAPAARRGGFATYAWLKVPHEVLQKCHEKCHNSGRALAP
jgi:hypothetical protein